jgi:hypothetical protein
MMMPGRHEVDELDDAALSRDLGLEHHRSTPIATNVRRHLLVSDDLPAAVVVLSEQFCEATPRVEARKAKPIDGTVSPDERSGLGVADHRVVLDGLCHHLQP